MQCKQCGKEVPQTKNKRKREFCNNTCKSRFWRNKKAANKNKKKLVMTPEEFMKKIGNKMWTELTKLDQEEMKKPIIEVPPELKGMDRTIWIAEWKEKNGL